MIGSTLLLAQVLRVAAWGGYEGVSRSADWSNVGAQLTLATARGHSAWIAGDLHGRFGERDLVGRIGATLHPAGRIWLTAEAGTSRDPVFMPKNTWEADVTALVGSRASAGVGYRRWNYTVGAVDMLTPHAAVQTRRLGWDSRLYISRNPSERTDVAFTLRVTRALGLRTALWLLGGGGRESYLVGNTVRSLDTITGAAGVRYNAGGGTTLRIALTVIDSKPVLSRRGVSFGVER